MSVEVGAGVLAGIEVVPASVVPISMVPFSMVLLREVPVRELPMSKVSVHDRCRCAWCR